MSAEEKELHQVGKLYKILHPDLEMDFGHMLHAVLLVIEVSFEALLFS